MGYGFYGEVFKVCFKEDGWFYVVKCFMLLFWGFKDWVCKLVEVGSYEKVG